MFLKIMHTIAKILKIIYLPLPQNFIIRLTGVTVLLYIFVEVIVICSELTNKSFEISFFYYLCITEGFNLLKTAYHHGLTIWEKPILCLHSGIRTVTSSNERH